MSLEETSKMFIKYFQFGFDLQKLAAHLKKNIREIETKLKEEIKSILIDLEGALLRAKRINNTIFINLINAQIQKKLICIEKILDPKSIQDFLSYYRSRLIQFNVNSPHHLQTVYPIGVDSRIKIYTQFVQYAKNQYFLRQQRPIQTNLDIIKKGFTQDKYEIFDQRQLDLIYVVFQKNNGNIALMCEQIQSRGLTDRKYERNMLQFKLSNLRVLGLYKVYKLTSTWMDHKILRWNKFVKCYGNLHEGWEPEDHKKLIRIAINDYANVGQIKDITLKMGAHSASLIFKQICREKVVYLGDITYNHPFDDIKNYQREDTNLDYVQEAEKLADSIREQIKKKIARNINKRQ